MFQIALGVNNDDTYSLRVIERMARRSGKQVRTDKPGIIFVEIDGLAFPVLQRALRDGHAPEMARWLAAGTHRLVEWETDLSSQTGASQAGILLGSNDDIPAFRWIEKETGTLMTCSAPRDCEEIERRHTNGSGLLVDGGTSRGNLLSGGAEEVILTVSRINAETKSQSRLPRVLRERTQRHAGVSRSSWGKSCSSSGPLRVSDGATCSHAGTAAGHIPFLRAGDVRRRSRPDRVLGDLGHASRTSCRLRHASPATTRSRTIRVSSATTPSRRSARSTSRSDGSREPAAMRRAPTRSSCSPTTGRHRARPSNSATGTAWTIWCDARSSARPVQTILGGDENETAVGLALEEARDTGAAATKADKKRLGDAGRRRARIRQPRPHLPDGRTAPAVARGDRDPPPTTRPGSPRASACRFRARPLIRSWTRGARALAALTTFDEHHVEGDDPLRAFSVNAARHLARSDGFEHAPDLFVNSFYDRATRRRVRLRGADLVPRRHGRLANAAIHPRARRPAAPRAADRGRGAGARSL